MKVKLGLRMFLSVGLLIAVMVYDSSSSWGAGCNDSCGDHVDCTQETCKECEDIGGGEKRCLSCCRHDDPVDCLSPCYWSGDQCQNVQGVDCSGIPEVSSKHKGFILWGAAVVASGLAIVLWQRRKKNVSYSKST